MRVKVNSRISCNILIIDDSWDDAELLAIHLKQEGIDASCTRVDTMAQLKRAASEKVWHVALCDMQMPQLTPEQVLAYLREYDPDLPVIILSGVVREADAIPLFKAGALSFIAKDALARLAPMVRREVGNLRNRQHLNHHRQITTALHALPVEGVICKDFLQNLIVCNLESEWAMGYLQKDVLDQFKTFSIPIRITRPAEHSVDTKVEVQEWPLGDLYSSLPDSACSGVGTCCITQHFSQIINPEVVLGQVAEPLFIDKPAFSVCPNFLLLDWGDHCSCLCQAVNHPRYRAMDCFSLMRALHCNTSIPCHVCTICNNAQEMDKEQIIKALSDLNHKADSIHVLTIHEGICTDLIK
uniref:Putative response regulator receiver protein n=1 Tax=Magnetococcus massalia (strain MO-1) TaxID=451514 RepID=A0A1S7LIE4_MAGMO|nr:putative response regulator receiver protein [Candidatus Magnetococcus massalia]